MKKYKRKQIALRSYLTLNYNFSNKEKNINKLVGSLWKKNSHGRGLKTNIFCGWPKYFNF